MIRVVAVGKIKEAFFTQAVEEYSKRLSGYYKLQIIEVPDEKCDDKTLEKEADKILKNLKENDFVITLEIRGQKFSSEGFAEKIRQLELEGKSSITFVIGGSLGLSQEVSERADLKLSFSDMTFTHQLIRILLVEQIYRAFKINANEPYHR